MEQDIQTYLAEDKIFQDSIEAVLDQVQVKGAEYETLNQQRSQLNIWQRLKTFKQFRRDNASILSVLKENKGTLRSLRNSRDQLRTELVARVIRKSIANSDMLNTISHIQEKLDATSRLNESNKRLVDMGMKALREISEASSSVSSAQTMEVLDLATKNKGISVMSSLSNSAASSEIDDVKRAVKAFEKALGDHRDLIGSLQHSFATEFIDLGMDFIALNDAFDFGSVFSLFSLSSASSALDVLDSRVKTLMPDLNRAASNSADEYTRVKEEYFEVKLQACRPGYDLLIANGVDVSPKRYDSAIESYRIFN